MYEKLEWAGPNKNAKKPGDLYDWADSSQGRFELRIGVEPGTYEVGRRRSPKTSELMSYFAEAGCGRDFCQKWLDYKNQDLAEERGRHH